MLDEIDSKTVHHIKTKKVMDREKRSKTLTEVKPVKNISKNLLNLLEISPVQKEVLPLHLNWKTIAYKKLNLFGLREDNSHREIARINQVIQVHLT